VHTKLSRCEELPPPPPPPPKKGKPVPPKPLPPPAPTPPQPEEPTGEPVPVPGPEQPTPPVPPPAPPDPPRGGSAGLCVRPIQEPVTYADARDVLTASTQYSQVLQQSVQSFTSFEGVLKDATTANALTGSARSAALQALAPRYDAFVQQFYRLSEATRVQAERFTLCTNTLPEWINELKTRY
jgi:hypothetical protein